MKLGEELGFGPATAAAVATENADARTVRMEVRCILVDGQMLDWCGPMKSERSSMAKGVGLLRLFFLLLLLLMRKKEGNLGFFVCSSWKWR